MSRIGAIAVTTALLAVACTPAEGAPTSTIPETLTTVAPVTTLAPPSTTTSTTVPAVTTTTTAPLPENECEVAPITNNESYSQGCTVLGIKILAAEEVNPAAVDELADRTYNMLVQRPEYAAAISEYPIGIRVIGVDQQINKLPEFDEIYFHHPGTDWRRAGRSFPGTELIPYAAGAEENLLCSEDDRYVGEDMFLKDFAITIRRFAMGAVDEATSHAIEQAYGVAIAEGKWLNTLSEINSDQYWSEGVQSFFDANLENTEEDREPNSSHNHVNTRDELREYDRALWAIAVSVFGDTEWRPSCS
ncbi:MAG: hypothetical protein ABFR95_11610 [Actinomycetota bacterium]